METRTQTATCPACQHREQVAIYPNLNVAADPDLKARVLDGSLFVWECPRCGAKNLIRYPALYHDPHGRLMVWLLPEGEATDPGLQDQMDTASQALDGYTLRRVGDVGSLLEKILIHDAGLDDTVVEMVKYVTRLEMIEKNRDRQAALAEAPLKFFKIEGADNQMVLSFPLDGAMHGISVGFHVYEDCRGILSRNPSVRPDEGFAKVDAAWLARYVR